MFTMLAACIVLTLVVTPLARTHDRRLSRLLAAQEAWAERMDRRA